MPSVTITIADTPTGGVSIHTDYQPAVGNPCSRAQSAALDIIRRTRKEYGLAEPTGETGGYVMQAGVAQALDQLCRPKTDARP
ncbi:MAG: hypothetical protein H7293_08995 [Candidatus Saccharibacteria bacterium]|nr:hypothetical protein [Rhodoferax sp.]